MSRCYIFLVRLVIYTGILRGMLTRTYWNKFFINSEYFYENEYGSTKFAGPASFI